MTPRPISVPVSESVTAISRESLENIEIELRMAPRGVFEKFAYPPVVLFDMDTDQGRVLCGEVLVQEEETWIRMLTARDRMQASCTIYQHDGSCMQFSDPVLGVEFRSDGRWRIVSVLTGTVGTSSPHTAEESNKILRELVNNATCP